MDAPSLSYLLTHPLSIGIAFIRPLALLLLLATPLFLLLRPRSGGQLASLLRAGAFSTAVLSLAGLRLSTPLPTEQLTLVAAVDLSESIDETGREWQQRYLDQLVATLAPGDELAAITFASDVHLARPPAPPSPLEAIPLPDTQTATNLENALVSAAALLPADGTRRILLLTDGNETRGDSRRQIPWLRAAGIRVDAAVPPHSIEADVRLDKLVVPPIVTQGAVVPLRAIAHNSGPARPVVFNLYLDGAIADSAAVELLPGLNVIELPTEITGLGTMRLRAEIAVANDPTPSNNYRDVGITVRGKTRVLLVTPHDHSALAVLLAPRGFELDVRKPADAPRSTRALLPYHAVIFEDVGAGAISAQSLAALESWVGEMGGGFVLAGGGSTFGDERFQRTPLQRLLPVTLEPRRPRRGAREPLALFLVIDRSNSMGYNSRIPTLRDGERLRYAKEASLAVVRQLKDQDLLGVIAFDSRPHEISPLRTLRASRAELEDLIPRLVEGGGTDFYDALISARRQLAASRVNRRHIVLLTDGDTNRANVSEYRSLIRDLAADQISVTTIRIGDNTINLELLQDISGGTGGEFHYVEDAQKLPELMLRDATRALSPFSDESQEYFPEIGQPLQLLHGIEENDLPPLRDYAYAQPKPGAEIPLQVARLERHDPLLAVWHYGLGRVAAFTASPAEDAEPWLAWTGLAKFWSQLAHWVARASTEHEYAVETRRVDGVTELTVRTFGPASEGAVLLARLHLSPEVTREVGLAPREPRVFAAALPDLRPGRYGLTIVNRAAATGVTEVRESITVPEADEEPQEEHLRTEPNLSLLGDLTASTGGELNPAARDLAQREKGSRKAHYPLDPLLLPLAMLLFLGDTAARRLDIERTRDVQSITIR